MSSTCRRPSFQPCHPWLQPPGVSPELWAKNSPCWVCPKTKPLPTRILTHAIRALFFLRHDGIFIFFSPYLVALGLLNIVLKDNCSNNEGEGEQFYHLVIGLALSPPSHRALVLPFKSVRDDSFTCLSVRKLAIFHHS